MMCYNPNSKYTCLNCKYKCVTDEDELYCELSEDITEEDDFCDDYEKE